MIYIILYVAAVFWAFIVWRLYTLQTSKGKKMFLWPVFLALCLVAGLRGYSVGSDTCGYVDTFRLLCKQTAYEVSKGTNIEYIHLLFVRLLTFLTTNPQIYLLVSSAVICSGIGKFIYDNSDHVCISTFVFMGLYYLGTMSVLRQYMAIAIAIQSIALLRKKKYFGAVAWSLAALVAHKSAVIFWGIEILYFMRLKRLYAPMITIAALLLWGLYKSGFMFDIIALTPYAHYIGSKYMKASYTGGTINYVFLSITAFSVFYLWAKRVYQPRTEHKNRTARAECWFYISMMLFDCVLLVISRQYMLFTRFSMFFDIFVLLLIPAIFREFRRLKPMAYAAVTSCMLLTTALMAPDYAYEFLVKTIL